MGQSKKEAYGIYTKINGKFHYRGGGFKTVKI